MSKEEKSPAQPREQLLAEIRAQSLAELNALIKASHNPELAKDVMVYQLWADGKITLQEGGSRLWLRTLRQYLSPFYPAVSIKMPVVHRGSSYAFVELEPALKIRNLMMNIVAVDLAIQSLMERISGVDNAAAAEPDK